jgi:SAM-dependent methyltransferase
MLRATLEYLATRTDLVRRSPGGRYMTGKQYNGESRFLIELYACAYGANALRLRALLRKPELAAKAVDRAAFARAFRTAQVSRVTGIPEILRQLKINHLLDLGCGGGDLLCELAVADSTFVGWGMDSNAALCKATRARLRKSRLGGRVKILLGDGGNPRNSIPIDVRKRLQGVTACQFANEFFRNGTSSAVTWLRRLRQILPGRPLIVADYYGRLGYPKRRADRLTLLHDFAQVISGQGVPPPDVSGWHSVYAAAGCHLLHALEDRVTTRFLHIVKL